MSTDTASTTLSLGAVHLTVRDLDRQATFYRSAIGLLERRRSADLVELGTAAATLLVLHHDAAATPRPLRTSGLYHLAILFPDRSALASALMQLALTQTALDGAADHLVSEALYLSDPEGNGIELYADRPRSQWPWAGNQVRMTTDPLDLSALLESVAPHQSADYRVPAATVLGHVHLNVGDLPRAEAFYCTLIGLQLMQYFGDSAAFVAADGYHHHLGLNIWNGRSAPPPPAGSRGLHSFEIIFHDAAAAAAAIRRLSAAAVPFEQHAATLSVRDPFGHLLQLRLP